MMTTFETKVRDQTLISLFSAYAEIFARVEHALYVDLHARGRLLKECKQDTWADSD